MRVVWRQSPAPPLLLRFSLPQALPVNFRIDLCARNPRWLFLLALLLLPGLALAQEARVVGTITGPDGASLPIAEVSVLSAADGSEVARLTSDSDGKFRTAVLPAGNYRLLVTAPGFDPAELSIALDGFDHQIALALRVAGVRESVTVAERARLDMLGVPGSVDLVPAAIIEDTPAHNLEDVMAFVPGVMAQSRFGADESKLSVRGSGLRNNFHHRGLNLLINGIPYTDADGFSDFESIEWPTRARYRSTTR